MPLESKPTLGHAALVALLALGLAASCGTPPPPPQTGPAANGAAERKLEPPEPPLPDQAPATVPLGQLDPDASREVRVTAIVEQIIGMRLVPAKVIFKVRDNSGSVTAVINERVELTEGQRIEMVGHYKPIPSPMHDGPGDGAQEPVFVVERYIVF